MSAQSAEMDQVPSPGLRDHVFFRLVAVGVCSARQAHRERFSRERRFGS